MYTYRNNPAHFGAYVYSSKRDVLCCTVCGGYVTSTGTYHCGFCDTGVHPSCKKKAVVVDGMWRWICVACFVSD